MSGIDAGTPAADSLLKGFRLRFWYYVARTTELVGGNTDAVVLERMLQDLGEYVALATQVSCCHVQLSI